MFLLVIITFGRCTFSVTRTWPVITPTVMVAVFIRGVSWAWMRIPFVAFIVSSLSCGIMLSFMHRRVLTLSRMLRVTWIWPSFPVALFTSGWMRSVSAARLISFVASTRLPMVLGSRCRRHTLALPVRPIDIIGSARFLMATPCVTGLLIVAWAGAIAAMTAIRLFRALISVLNK